MREGSKPPKRTNVERQKNKNNKMTFKKQKFHKDYELGKAKAGERLLIKKLLKQIEKAANTNVISPCRFSATVSDGYITLIIETKEPDRTH